MRGIRIGGHVWIGGIIEGGSTGLVRFGNRKTEVRASQTSEMTCEKICILKNVVFPTNTALHK